MTPLRQRMLDDMRLKGYAPATQGAYIQAIRGLAAHFHRSPELLSEEDLRQYFLYLTQEKKAARSTVTIAMCAIKFLFQATLQRGWTTLTLLRPLPRGFTKVRHYGLYSSPRKADLERARALLGAPPPEASSDEMPTGTTTDPARPCPSCNSGHLRVVETIAPLRLQARAPP